MCENYVIRVRTQIVSLWHKITLHALGEFRCVNIFYRINPLSVCFLSFLILVKELSTNTPRELYYILGHQMSILVGLKSYCLIGPSFSLSLTHTHTHTHKYINIYIYIQKHKQANTHTLAHARTQIYLNTSISLSFSLTLSKFVKIVPESSESRVRLSDSDLVLDLEVVDDARLGSEFGQLNI